MRTPVPFRLVTIGLLSLALAACQAGSRPASPADAVGLPAADASSGASPNITPPAPAAISPLPGLDGQPSLAWLLVGHPGTSELQVILSTTGEVSLTIPDGAPRTNWDRVVTTTADENTTIVRDLIVQPGFGGPEVRIAGRWQLPTVGLDPTLLGRSLDGSTIALVEAPSGGSPEAAPSRSRFAILEHRLMDVVQTAGDTPFGPPRVIELPGTFEYDALSPDGRILYVVEHLDAEQRGRYQVRAVDVATGVMRDAVIVDKTKVDETMAGSPIAQVRRPGGVVLTLYRGPEHPFIHALNSAEAWAVCIDLPTGAGASTAGADGALDWGLAPSADGTAVYAVNASLGVVVDVDPIALSVRRSAAIATTAVGGPAARSAGGSGSIVLAKFGHADSGPIGRRVVASPDGRWIFAAGSGGIAAIRAKDLAIVRHDLPDAAIDGLGITPDGTVLFALLRASGEIVALTTGDGTRLAPVPGSGFDRLLAVAAW